MLATEEYRVFLKKYRNLIMSARRSMDTPLQRNLMNAVAATAFQAGFNAGQRAEPGKKLKLRKWKTNQDPAATARHS